MNTESMLSLLRDELRNISPGLPAELPARSHFKYDWNLDSLELVEFVARIEQRFGLLIPDEDLPAFTSLQATVDYLKAHLPQ